MKMMDKDKMLFEQRAAPISYIYVSVIVRFSPPSPKNMRVKLDSFSRKGLKCLK